ncbi:tetratricopeptide repeat protein [Parahaliea mediterranea]|uniref:Tetratricopeptide repeat protein n=1 Tax=Parahaliea mediterranea TaxID=651086 RepID=A0A939DJU4_9GAMM|nr:tetratricopeptide repeat protein [Parahaliea mediterranea]MBN7798762.1 tetratricopeptide repeat protein [Parahaliea mediterranea]
MNLRTLLCCASAAIFFTSAAPGNAGSSEENLPQAVSLLGKELYAGTPTAAALGKYDAAKQAYEAAPNDPDKLIWYGRRAAYLGHYQEAIEIFSEGVEKHPRDIRILRHRGHRYISTRQFDKAIEDLSKAARLMVGQEDQVEPDGMPNAKNIPLTTTQGNIRYHLGLAYYLKQDWETARRIFADDLGKTDNDDGIVASTHWLYMILRRMGRDQEAEALLDGIHADMNIIENFAYHRACLFYKGEIPLESVLPEDTSGSGNAGLVYGVANWHLYNGKPGKAREIMQGLLDGPQWAAFGYIAAEADLAAGEL